MGEIIRIREETGPLQFRIWYTTTGEEREVTVDTDKAGLFRTGSTAKPSLACPFLRTREDGRIVCTVHGSRPDLCRQYSCFRVLVLDPAGTRIGRVTDASRYLVTTDLRLRTLWEEKIRPMNIPDEGAWEAFVEETLARHGFSVIR